jgi:hypothetical protein
VSKLQNDDYELRFALVQEVRGTQIQEVRAARIQCPHCAGWYPGSRRAIAEAGTEQARGGMNVCPFCRKVWYQLVFAGAEVAGRVWCIEEEPYPEFILDSND